MDFQALQTNVRQQLPNVSIIIRIFDKVHLVDYGCTRDVDVIFPISKNFVGEHWARLLKYFVVH